MGYVWQINQLRLKPCFSFLNESWTSRGKPVVSGWEGVPFWSMSDWWSNSCCGNNSDRKAIPWPRRTLFNPLQSKARLLRIWSRAWLKSSSPHHLKPWLKIRHPLETWEGWKILSQQGRDGVSIGSRGPLPHIRFPPLHIPACCLFVRLGGLSRALIKRSALGAGGNLAWVTLSRCSSYAAFDRVFWKLEGIMLGRQAKWYTSNFLMSDWTPGKSSSKSSMKLNGRGQF